jgi:hypothetical protein
MKKVAVILIATLLLLMPWEYVSARGGRGGRRGRAPRTSPRGQTGKSPRSRNKEGNIRQERNGWENGAGIVDDANAFARTRNLSPDR